MPFNMNFSKETLSGPPPLPDGTYTLQFLGFKPAKTKTGDSINLFPQFGVVGMPEYANRKISTVMNMGGAFAINDMLHSMGMKMEVVQDGNQGTEAENYTIPGVFEGAEQFPEDPSKWKYQGPLTNKTFTAEVCTKEYNGRKNNDIRQYFCSVPGCSEKHSTNLVKD